MRRSSTRACGSPHSCSDSYAPAVSKWCEGNDSTAALRGAMSRNAAPRCRVRVDPVAPRSASSVEADASAFARLDRPPDRFVTIALALAPAQSPRALRRRSAAGAYRRGASASARTRSWARRWPARAQLRCSALSDPAERGDCQAWPCRSRSASRPATSATIAKAGRELPSLSRGSQRADAQAWLPLSESTHGLPSCSEAT